MNVIFMGSPASVISPLKHLISEGPKSNINLVAVVSQPAKPAGRKKKLEDPAIAKFAKENGILCLQPEKASAQDFLQQLTDLKVDIAITAAYGQILTDDFLATPKRATINIHPSLLPKYRGAIPVPAALLAGDNVTGVTILFTVKALDAGNIITQKSFEIENNETAENLTNRMFDLSGPLLIDSLKKLEDATFSGECQDESKVTHCKKITKEDGRIDWKGSAKEITNRWRAFYPWPGATCSFLGQDAKILSIWVKQENESFEGGYFYFDKKTKALVINCGSGQIYCDKLQLPGKKPVDAASFWNGVKDKTSARFE